MNVTDDWKNKEFYYFVGIDVRFATLKIKLTQAGINLFSFFFFKERDGDRDRERLCFNATFKTKRVWYSHELNVNLSQVLQKKKTDKRTCRLFKAESFKFFAHNWVIELWNRTLALRGHVTNVSFKQWVGILLMPKTDRAHKNYLTPEIWGETHLREIFYGTLIFQQSSMICIGRHVGGHTLALQYGGQNYFLLISC